MRNASTARAAAPLARAMLRCTAQHVQAARASPRAAARNDVAPLSGAAAKERLLSRLPLLKRAVEKLPPAARTGAEKELSKYLHLKKPNARSLPALFAALFREAEAAEPTSAAPLLSALQELEAAPAASSWLIARNPSNSSCPSAFGDVYKSFLSAARAIGSSNACTVASLACNTHPSAWTAAYTDELVLPGENPAALEAELRAAMGAPPGVGSLRMHAYDINRGNPPVLAKLVRTCCELVVDEVQSEGGHISWMHPPIPMTDLAEWRTEKRQQDALRSTGSSEPSDKALLQELRRQNFPVDHSQPPQPPFKLVRRTSAKGDPTMEITVMCVCCGEYMHRDQGTAKEVGGKMPGPLPSALETFRDPLFPSLCRTCYVYMQRNPTLFKLNADGALPPSVAFNYNWVQGQAGRISQRVFWRNVPCIALLDNNPVEDPLP